MKEIFDGNYYDEILNFEGTVILKVSTISCKPCRELQLILTDIENNNKYMNFRSIDPTKNGIFNRKYRIMSVPVLMKFRNGQLIDRLDNNINRLKVEKFVNG